MTPAEKKKFKAGDKSMDKKKLTKKDGIREEHFTELLKLYKKRENTERSWLVPVERVLADGCNLSAGHYNPHGPEEVELLEPDEYAAQIKELLAQAMVSVDSLMEEISHRGQNG